MKIIYFNEKQKKEYVNFVSQLDTYSLWQSWEWKVFQESVGRKTCLMGVESEGGIQASALIIKHKLPFKKCWLEISRGPVFSDEKALKTLFRELRRIAKKENVIFSRLNPFSELPTVTGVDFRNAHTDYHPTTTLLLDLKLSGEDLLKQMKPKGRYNIRLAEKKGVKVKESNDVDAFYSLLQETTARDKFSGHSKKYYEKMMKSLGDSVRLYLAEYQGKIIAGGIFAYIGNTAVYYYGASSSKYRNVMAPYAVQWCAIQEAKKRECLWYDFLGIAPVGKEKGHRWEGVTEFKRKFGGEVQEYPQALEIVYQNIWYYFLLLSKKFR